MPFGFGYYFEPTYILVLIGAVLSMIASARVNSTFNKYARVRSMSGMTGAQTAEAILRSRGIHDVRVEHIRGNLTDHYDRRKRWCGCRTAYMAPPLSLRSGWQHMSADMSCSTMKGMRHLISEQRWFRRQILGRS